MVFVTFGRRAGAFAEVEMGGRYNRVGDEKGVVKPWPSLVAIMPSDLDFSLWVRSTRRCSQYCMDHLFNCLGIRSGLRTAIVFVGVKI